MDGTLDTVKRSTINTLCGVLMYFERYVVSDALTAELGSVEVLQNEIPIDWRGFDQFKSRIAELQVGKAKITPYIGAFEVWHERTLLFSKLSSRVWPSCKVVAARVKAYLEDKKNKVQDLSKYNVKYIHPSSKQKSIQNYLSLASKAAIQRRPSPPKGDKKAGSPGQTQSPVQSQSPGSVSADKKNQTAEVKKEPISDFQGDEDAMHENQHELVEDPKKKPEKKDSPIVAHKKEPVMIIE